MIQPRHLVTLLAAVGIVTGGAVGVAYVGSAGPFAPEEPALAGFDTEPADCATPNATGSHVALRPAGDRTEVTVNRTVRFPDPAHAVANASVERTGEHEYALSVETVENDSAMAAQCIAVANYTATVSVPESSDERFTLVIDEDGEAVATVENGPNSAGMSGQASAPVPTNATNATGGGGAGTGASDG